VSLQIKQLQSELTAELNSILEYWSKYSLDTKNQGFVGQINANEMIDNESEKGSVLNARILWSF
jgi:mannobiose 2-epimerase